MSTPGEAASPEAPRWVGRLIASRYRLLRVLGVGGHGAVYEAQHELTDRRFAVKLLLSDSRQVRGLAERLVREAKAASRVVHPNVVEVIDVGIDADSGRLYLIEELLDGDDLRARMRARRRMTTQEVRAVMGPMLDGLGAAHEQGVVHRDLKPGNVMLARQLGGAEVPKLIDFGISKVEARGPKADDNDGPLTRDGMLLGTPDYMAPEQARGAQSVDARADLWSVGVLLYEMLAGVRPFRGNGPAAVIVAVATETPTPLAAHRPDLPPAWCALVHRCLARSPDERFASARALREALDAAGDQDASVALDDIPVVEPDPPDTLASAPVGPIAPPVAPGLDSVLETAEPAFTEPPAPPRRALPVTLPARDSWLWVLAALALFVAVGVGAWTRLRPGPVRDRPARRASTTSGRVDAGVVRADPVSLADQDARVLPQRLSVTQQRSLMSAFEPRARECAGPRFFGSLPVTLTVRGDGTVRLVRVGESLRGSAAERCVVEAWRSVTVPRFAAREMEIGWVYVIADQSQ